MRFSIECIDPIEAHFLRNTVLNYRTDLINKLRPQLFEIFMKSFKDEVYNFNLQNDQYDLKICTDDYKSINVKFYVKDADIHFTKISNIGVIQRFITNEIHSLLSNNNLDFVVEMFYLNDSLVWVKIYLFK